MPSVQVLNCEETGLLIRHDRLICDFCSSGRRFACGLLQIPPRDGHPCRPADSSPRRAHRGLAPPSECALPGAPKTKTASPPRPFNPTTTTSSGDKFRGREGKTLPRGRSIRQPPPSRHSIPKRSFLPHPSIPNPHREQIQPSVSMPSLRRRQAKGETH